jgi:hypothetical protein
VRKVAAPTLLHMSNARSPPGGWSRDGEIVREPLEPKTEILSKQRPISNRTALSETHSHAHLPHSFYQVSKVLRLPYLCGSVVGRTGERSGIHEELEHAGDFVHVHQR